MSSMVNIALWSKVDENTVGLHRVGLEHDRITCSKLSSGEQDLQLHEDKTSNNSRVIGRANRIARDFDYTCPWVDCLGRRVKTDEVGFNLDSGLVNLKGGGEKEDVIVIDSDDESDKKPPAKEEKKLVNDTIELLDSSDDEEDNTLLSSKRKAASSTSMCRSTMCSSTNTKMSVSDGNETFTYTSQDYEDVLLSKEIGGEVEVISGSAMVSIAKALSKEERDMIIQEYNEKAEAFDHQTDTSQLIDYSKVTLSNMRPGIALPIVFGQCCKHEVSFGNGGSVKGGRRQDFENHPSPSVRAILKLFESFPNQDDAFGWTPFFGVNGADTCPIGTLDANDEVIVICIIWIVIIAKERAESSISLLNMLGSLV